MCVCVCVCVCVCERERERIYVCLCVFECVYVHTDVVEALVILISMHSVLDSVTSAQYNECHTLANTQTHICILLAQPPTHSHTK